MNILRRLVIKNNISKQIFSDNIIRLSCNPISEQLKRTIIGKTYEGDGKTTGYILNKKGVEVICIDSISVNGFRLSNGWKIYGPAIFFPHTIVSWRIKNMNDICEESLSLFKILEPKVELILLGYGRREDMNHEKARDFINICRKLKINFEILPIEDAAATFNFCSLDKRFVAGAFIPPTEVIIRNEFDSLLKEDSVPIKLIG